MKAFLLIVLVSLAMLSDALAFDDAQSAQALIYIGVPLGRSADDPAYSFGVRVDREEPVNANRYASPVARKPGPIMDLHCDPDFEYSLKFNAPHDVEIAEGSEIGVSDVDVLNIDVSEIIERMSDWTAP